MDNDNAVQRDGAGGDAGGLDTPSIPNPATSATFERARLLAIAALVLARYRPSAREWRIIRRSAMSPRVRSTQLDELLIEATAPSPECADPLWWWGLTREQDAVLIAAARLRGYWPRELIEDTAKVAAAVVFGAAVTVKRRPHNTERERDSLVAVMQEGVNHAA